jgi:hypothetical protein
MGSLGRVQSAHLELVRSGHGGLVFDWKPGHLVHDRLASPQGGSPEDRRCIREASPLGASSAQQYCQVVPGFSLRDDLTFKGSQDA